MRVQFNASGAADAYAKAFRHLRSLPGFDHAAVLRAEAGVILKTWAGRTKVSTQAAVGTRARIKVSRSLGLSGRARGDGTASVSINAGLRGSSGRVWWHTRNNKFQLAGQMSKNGQTFAPRNLHFKRLNWADIREATSSYSAEIARALPRAMASVGLARQSIVQIADDLKIDLSTVAGGGALSAAGIAKARAAIASNGTAYRNGSGVQGGDASRAFVQLISRLPYGHKIGMDITLAGVLSGRAKYIETSYQKGAFKSVESATRAFPNVFKGAPKS